MHPYRFDLFEVDTDKFELRHDHVAVSIEPQSFKILQYLIENRDRMVSREELVENIWAKRAVSDWAISKGMRSARLAIGDIDKSKFWIRTIHGQGFRFVGEVSGQSGAAASNAGRQNVSSAGDHESRQQVVISIGVYPFSNLGASPDEDYFAVGVSDDIIAELANFEELFVPSRNTSFIISDQKNENAGSFGQQLNVQYVLEGSVRRFDNQLRINAQLTEVMNGRLVWAQRFDRNSADIFKLQDSLKEQIISSLKLRLISAPGKQGRNATDHPRAYDYCLRGRSQFINIRPPVLPGLWSCLNRQRKKPALCGSVFLSGLLSHYDLYLCAPGVGRESGTGDRTCRKNHIA